MYKEEELANFYGVLQNTQEFLEIDCGCTNPRYGDTPGKLRIYVEGKLEIDCTCRDDCTKGKYIFYVIVNISPIEFAKHAGRTNAHNNWKSQIWVFRHDGHKLALWKTCLLKYYTHTFQRPLRQVTHRDEFVRCSQCGKDRRFSVRSKEACRIYHNALVNNNWECSDMPNHSLMCNDAEERRSRKVCRGCPRDPKCEGCEKCVCFGCDECRFDDCSCQTCVQYIINL
ncbi:PREDICTED: protein ULTRAPETALA 1-like [Erythranthe guttata]|uniref:protein ULTRAPETALA 1-like n=1 Tax=Erythranthe guttata TaxID=4155 RepID=UPI00064D7C38|nr:PREDICTED: protein ULTRAPETALA 1-like [Erythranthe guttata]|eukprot:XP_012858987.1 PREDICTED: protein ULTRAPETALA 1-like [Erythranthe guttata]